MFGICLLVLDGELTNPGIFFVFSGTAMGVIYFAKIKIKDNKFNKIKWLFSLSAVVFISIASKNPVFLFIAVFHIIAKKRNLKFLPYVWIFYFIGFYSVFFTMKIFSRTAFIVSVICVFGVFTAEYLARKHIICK